MTVHRVMFARVVSLFSKALSFFLFHVIQTGDRFMKTNQNDIHQAVAKASGESVETIARRGFVLLTSTPREREPSRADYDDLLARSGTSTPQLAPDYDETVTTP